MSNAATTTTNRMTDVASPPAAVQTLNVRKDVMIQAPLDIVWESLLEEMGPAGQMPDGSPYARTLEAWPGGRWFRDLGNNTGHFWGHVQVIKPPKLLEIAGPMFMSYPVSGFLQYRLVEEAGGTRLSFTHQAVGLLNPEHLEGMPKGWTGVLDDIK